MSYGLTSYLRTHRRRHGLTQDEVAFLLGIQSGTHVSRIEREIRKPSVTTLIACSHIFSLSPEALFPGLCESTRQIVGGRAETLYLDLQGNDQRATPAKLDLLETIIWRASKVDNPSGL